MDAKEFIELNSVAFEDVTFRQGNTIKIHIEELHKIMEQYHQSKVNSVVVECLQQVNATLERHGKVEANTELHNKIRNTL